ncbi:MAG: TonB-dependent receptor [Bacteroidetes bacterium]|nr:MAG: TonB-dependent receptor [Bacteroidota bacterium]
MRQNQVDVFIPGIGVNYQYSRELQFFAGVHRGFSPPGNKEGTRPEKSINYELGARLNKGALSGQTALFFSDYDNLLGTDLAAAGGGGTGDLFNGGAVQTKGLELQLTYDPLTGSGSSWTLPLTVVYTFTDAEFQNSFESDFEGWGTVQKGDELPYLPRNQLTLMAGLQGPRFALNLSARYQDAMRTQAGQGPIPEDQKTDAYFVLDANASYALHPKVSLFASMTNLTDAVYVVARRPAGLRPGMPRTFMGGLKVKF